MTNARKPGKAEIGRRLDFLMSVTNTRNAQLARALSFDASYISRIRAGKRGVPPELPFIEPAAAFFVRNMHEGYQKEALAREMGISGEWPADASEAARLIAAWLEGTGDCCCAGADSTTAAPASDAPLPSPRGRRAEAHLFFGEEGRREAALAFLSRVARAGEPCELLLQSDEDTAWMYRDTAFTSEWAQLMVRLAECGCTFTVVHTVSRDGNEMWEGVREWLPLYLTGAMRPYYYPRLRDGVRGRSLFVARGRCALVSSSVQGMEGDEMCVLLDDGPAVSALEREFEAYLALCEPLMQTEHPQSRDDLDALLERFRSEGPSVTTEVSGAIVSASAGRGAIVSFSGEQPVVYRIVEPRLADALLSYIGCIPNAGSGSHA